MIYFNRDEIAKNRTRFTALLNERERLLNRLREIVHEEREQRKQDVQH